MRRGAGDLWLASVRGAAFAAVLWAVAASGGCADGPDAWTQWEPPPAIYTFRRSEDPVVTPATRPAPPPRPSGDQRGAEYVWEAASPDGSMQLVVDIRGVVRLLDASRKRELRRWDALAGQNVERGAFRCDGRRVAAGSDEQVVVWDVNTGELIASYRPSMCFSRLFVVDERWFAAYYQNYDALDYSYVLQDLDTGEVTHLARPPEGRRHSAHLAGVWLKNDATRAICSFVQWNWGAPEGTPVVREWLCTYETPGGRMIGFTPLPDGTTCRRIDPMQRGVVLGRYEGLVSVYGIPGAVVSNESETWEIVPLPPGRQGGPEGQR